MIVLTPDRVRTSAEGRVPSALFLVGLLTLILGATTSSAGPVTAAWPVDGPDDTTAVAAAGVAGWYATADSYEDNVEIRDVQATLVHTVTKAQIEALLPWMSLNGSQDGLSGLAWSDSGRQLFILVHDAAPAGDGQPSDAVLRYDVPSGALTLFARLELFDSDAAWPHLAAAHFKGRLYVGSGLSPTITVINAPSSAATGSVLSTVSLPAGAAVHGLTIDRDNSVLYAASDAAIYRSSATASPLSFSLVGSLSGIRSMTFGDHYGGPMNRGLFVLRDTTSPAVSRIDFVAAAQAAGTQAFAPTLYASTTAVWHALAATSDGKLLIGADEDAVAMTDSSDLRLGLDAFLADEFSQHVALAKGLISPDGEPPGWVIDADVVPSISRFHPATPDAAAWAVLMLIAADVVQGDPQARPLVRTILTRYAGLASDGIAPSRSADGIYRHWIDPATGGVKPGWDPEFATLSTMKILAAAARAQSRWPEDAVIRRAGNRIVFGVVNWDAYLNPVTDAMSFKGLPAGGPDWSSASKPFFEGIIFVEQAARYGGAVAGTSYSRWLDRGNWPTASYLVGHPITSTSPNAFGAAFISLYSHLLQSDYRAVPAWRQQVQNLRWSSAAWTDDFGPKFYTVFSAGTTRSDWGGYNADSLGFHPGNVTTFTSLIATAAAPGAPNPAAEAVSAYHAYRKGGRQAFKSGAILLYRRSDVDRTYTPNSAGLPDVTLAGLAIGELLHPGLIDGSLAIPYPAAPICDADWNANGTIEPADIAGFVNSWVQSLSTGSLSGDFDGNSTAEPADIAQFITAWLSALSGGC
ncbi:MAG: hypothetical protein KF745_00110 [Phycisphaeraceae bacterium]|nr:hypothetical protein [Phycisphaeraceae bacterium]